MEENKNQQHGYRGIPTPEANRLAGALSWLAYGSMGIASVYMVSKAMWEAVPPQYKELVLGATALGIAGIALYTLFSNEKTSPSDPD